MAATYARTYIKISLKETDNWGRGLCQSCCRVAAAAAAVVAAFAAAVIISLSRCSFGALYLMRYGHPARLTVAVALSLGPTLRIRNVRQIVSPHCRWSIDVR